LRGERGVMIPSAHPSPQLKWHLDRFNRFCTVHDCDRPTTDRPRYSVGNNRPHILSTGRRSPNFFCLFLGELGTNQDKNDNVFIVFGRRFALCYRTVVCPVCLSDCLWCWCRLLWPNGWMDQDETWHRGRPGPGHIVLDRDPALPTERDIAPPLSKFEDAGRATQALPASV